MPTPQTESFISTASVGEGSEVPDSQEMVASTSSQNTVLFKRPRRPPKAKQIPSNASEAQTQLEPSLRDPPLEEMLARVKELESRNSFLEQQAQRQAPDANVGNGLEIMRMLQKELERQRQESKEQLEQLRQDHRHEMNEVIGLIKWSLPSSLQPKDQGRELS